MPSPSPNSRRSSSSVASRNLSGSSRADLLTPRGLHQSFYTSSNNSAASRALHENIDDHKENSTENGHSKGTPGRTNHNQKGPSKKPWATHFSKPAATLSPSHRVLVDRNSSCSPVRSRSIASGNGETLSDKKVARPTPPRAAEEASVTPSTGKDVAELSKRIQQFLEDQDVLLGVKTGSALEAMSTCPLVTPAESGQHPSSSPYNPYKSPFFERPKFLRLNGNVSSVEGADIVCASTDGVGMLMEPPTEELPLFEGDQVTEELPLFEGDQVLVTPLQQIQFRSSLSPSSNEDHEEARLEENCEEQMFGANTAVEASMGAPETKALPTFEGEANCSHEQKREEKKEATCKPPEEDDETATIQALGQFQDQVGQAQDQLNMADVKVEDVTTNVAPLEAIPVCQDKDQNLSMATSKSDEMGVTVDGDDMSLGKKAVRVLLSGALLVTFLTLVLLSSASPALLPRYLVDNPVSSFWQSSKYHEHSMLVVRGLDGLWGTDKIYIPADARLAVLRSAELYQVIGKQLSQAQQKLQLYVQVASSIADNWSRFLVQRLPLGTNPDTSRENEDRARQFEWIQEYEFEEEWVDEFPKPVYTDWELLHEYDLGAANQFVLGSLPDSLKNDIRRNFSRLSDCPEVKNLLEDLMKLKGGNTEEDRLEVLQYFWEYRRFSASAHKSLMNFRLETTAIEVDSENQGLSTSSNHQDVEPSSEDVEMHDDQGHQKIQSTDSSEHIEGNHHQTPTENDEKSQFTDNSEHIEGNHYRTPTENDELLHDLEVHLLEKRGMEQEHIVPEMSEMALKKLQESTVNDNEAASSDSMHELLREVDNEDTSSMDIQTIQPTSDVSLDIAPDSMHELQTEVGNEDTSSTDKQVTQPTSDVNLGIAQLATLATFIAASFLILGRNRESKKVVKLISRTSSVQFLRKCDHPPNSMDDEVHQNRQLFVDVKQDKKQVTMIEELSDRFASVLQSPEPNNLPLRSTHVSKDEELVRSPIPTSATSPYGSFTTYKLMSKKEGQATETKLTPVRRSSRIRNHVSMSPNANGVKRIAISPP